MSYIEKMQNGIVNSALSDGPDLGKETLDALKTQVWEHGWLYP